MKWLLSFLLLLASLYSLSGQYAAFNLDLSVSVTPGLSTFNYIGKEGTGVYVSSKRTPGFEASVSYIRQLAANTDVEFAFYYGVHPINFDIHFDESFVSSSTLVNPFKFKDYALKYRGLGIGLRYRLLQLDRSSFGLYFGGNATYMSTISLSFKSDYHLPDKSRKRFVDMHGFINPDVTLFFAPNYGLWYKLRLNARMEAGLTINKVVSKHVSFETSADHNLHIYGDNEVVTVSLKKIYRQFGAGLSFYYVINR